MNFIQDFKKVNSITGWVICAIASTVYLLTIEPTTSFWDCGEFITAAYTLQVGHPPGAPFYMLVARMFTLLAGGNVNLVPLMVNAFSALCSGFTILLLFWTITHLGRKITGIAIEKLTVVQTVSIVGSGIVGALAYTFSDTFWFSAVEAEVYAMSSLFTALVFWAVLRWEDEADQRYANRWLIFIAYLMGLSIGVHLLNLLAIPAIGLVIYHRKNQNNITIKGAIYALIASAGVLFVILYMIVPGVVQGAIWFELIFVKNYGLPMTSGIWVYAILFLSAILYGLWYSIKHNKRVLNTGLLAFTVIIIGFSSYALTIIRSSAKPPMNQNNPQNIFNLQRYLNREQYGYHPLFVGPYFNSPAIDIKEGNMQYLVKDGQYVEIGPKTDHIFRAGTTTVFPRMYSRQSSHISGYKQWANIPERQPDDRIPTFAQNLRFFFNYQVGHMYMRYFMWNFVGRQNDIQGHGGPLNGNWISGIKIIDEARLGPQDIPDSMNNRARNTYYFLPLILGLVGMAYQWQRNKPDFWVVMMLFFMTGLAIVVYLNQTPYQPRERDYAYAGSFYAFAIWIGLGVMAIIETIPERFRNKNFAMATLMILLLLVPGIMAKENWDDHNRARRYTALDFAYNYLISTEPNAIIFSNGDNDTFPLWHLQEVIGVRTDVRVCNLSYLSADWYIEQMQRAAHESAPLPIAFARNQYITGTREQLFINELEQLRGGFADLRQVMDFVRSDDIRTKGAWLGHQNGGFLWSEQLREEFGLAQFSDVLEDFLPTKNFKIPVDKEKVIANGTVALKDTAFIVDEIQWTLRGEGSGRSEHIFKNSMMVLDILANNNWERPIYFAITVPPEHFMNLQDFFQMDGMAYRLVPVHTSDTGGVYADKLYDLMMNQFRWGNVSDPRVYLCETNTRLLTSKRGNFSRLASALIAENKIDSAIMALDRAFEVIPTYQLPINIMDWGLLEQYYKAGAKEKGDALAEEMFAQITEEIDYLKSFPRQFSNSLRRDVERRETMLYLVCRITRQHSPQLFDRYSTYWNRLFPGEPFENMMMFDDEIEEWDYSE